MKNQLLLNIALLRAMPLEIVEAAKYFTLAADQTHSDAQSEYAKCLRHDYEIRRNVTEW
jgi:TPR repeat protein